MKTIRYIFQIILTFLIATSMVFLFFVFTLPALQVNRAELAKQEMEMHNQTLEMIKQDFSHVLTAENVYVEMYKDINITISGNDCDLKVVLNRELKLLTLETIDKTENAYVGPGFACAGEGVALIFAIVWFCLIIKDIAEDISMARDRRRAIKNAKKQKQADIEVLV